MADLLDSLRQGAHEQAAALTGRLPSAGMFELFLKQQGPADQFRFGRQADAPRPRRGAGKTWTYGSFPDRGDRGATLPVVVPQRPAEFAR